jgi:hypothetical protein
VTYRQDSVPRTCAICRRPIEPDQFMLGIFVQKEWAHEACTRTAIETFLLKRRAREAKEATA